MSMQKEQELFQSLAKLHNKEIMEYRKNRDQQSLMALQEKLIAEVKDIMKKEGGVKFTPEQIEAYTTLGGTPHLDNQYTVFGEVTDGMDIVEKIQNCVTSSGDRPKEDISMTMKLI